MKVLTALTYPDLIKVFREELLSRLQRDTGLSRKLRLGLFPRQFLPLNGTVTVSGNGIAVIVVDSVLDELLERTF